MYKCVVCKKEYEDLWIHLTGREKGSLNGLDEAHEAYLALIMNSKKGRFYMKPCFCGGTIVSSGTSKNGSVTWEDSCTKCGFLLDED